DFMESWPRAALQQMRDRLQMFDRVAAFGGKLDAERRALLFLLFAPRVVHSGAGACCSVLWLRVPPPARRPAALPP
ncbi:MAG: hypothetical protein ACK4ZJ_16820, partial [Allorhizobium sp.]